MFSLQLEILLRRGGDTDDIKYQLIIILQTELCSPSELDCLDGIEDSQADCVERCEGTIMDLEKHSYSVKNEAGLEPLIAAYESYKYPESSNLTYPDTMKSQSRDLSADLNSCISRPHIQKQPEVHSDLHLNLNL